MIVSTGFIRPFGYYDGMLFEVRSLELSYDRPVAAGRSLRRPADAAGRFGQASGAVGCMVRPGRAIAEAGA